MGHLRPWHRIANDGSLSPDCFRADRTPPQPTRGALIHHSDRGGQYACAEYTEILAAYDIQPSMSRVGNPYDNAKAESFMKTLKQEEITGSSYRNLHQARSAIGALSRPCTTVSGSIRLSPIAR
jgi:transposase InsO family protein